MLADGGAAFAALWKGTAVEFGKDNICTRTGRWSRRDSVKNFALWRIRDWQDEVRMLGELTSSPQASEISPCFVDARALLTPASAIFTIWCSPSGMSKRTRKVVPSRTCSTMAKLQQQDMISITQVKETCSYHRWTSPSIQWQMHESQQASCSVLGVPWKRLSHRKKGLIQLTCWPWGFHIPFPAALASFSISFFLLSSSVASRLISFNFAQPFLSNSEVRSTPATSAWPRSREISSLVGREWIDVKEISLPTVSVRRNSRDSKAQGCRWLVIPKSVHWKDDGHTSSSLVDVPRRGAARSARWSTLEFVSSS